MLTKIATGKVRDLYSSPPATAQNALIFVASDRISAFDIVLSTDIPDKGALLTLLSAHWFAVLPDLLPKALGDGFRHHFIKLGVPLSPSSEEEIKENEDQTYHEIKGLRTMTVKKLQIIPIEVIVRGYLTGSAWAEYTAHKTVHGIPLPPGLRKSEKLPTGPLYTPSTKAPPGEHDENIHPDRAAEIIGSPAIADRVRELAIALYTAAAAYAEERGIIIADTKFEFGIDEAGEVVLADEVLTPDSSRFWDKAKYVVGEEQESFDKQPMRDWLVAQGLKGKSGVELPEDVVMATAKRYKAVFGRLVGRTFEEVRDSVDM